MTSSSVMTLAASVLWAAAWGVAHAGPATMTATGITSTPIGAYEFCKTNPADCTNPAGDAGPLILTKDRWNELLTINHQVNSTITPETDEQLYGVEEHWTYPQSAGDCEDYALLKRKLLIESGFSPSDLLMTVVLLPSGEGHAVLAVRTDRGDFILDELRDSVLLWSETEYTYLKRQSAGDPTRWVKLQDGRASAVGSVKQ
ncbi:transglutaminase-like cysteine peptidase [Mesorhizobium sp. B2-3-5]|uniref:transglutaminase-like cysteine peptidase n=1 Tax=Mesorhizobium sp. B2-3-5 TaxID=2589958 RepID=UPI00112B9B43|nr:transglutaminase-like cysteine peptidase [Mesorhizobium sp. B2-3-5]TPM26915.1 transglutaminase [Mesorhizobium sp. B2-3-5]